MSEKTIHDILAQFREEALNNRHMAGCFERYQITIDKASGIKNDPNGCCKEHNTPATLSIS